MVRSSLVDPKERRFANLPHIAPDSLERNTGQILGYRTVAEDGVTSGKYLFQSGDVLYSKIRPNLNKVAIARFNGLCSADMYAIRTIDDVLSTEYLAHVLRSDGFLEYAAAMSNRANIPKLNRQQLLGFTLNLPTLCEQRRIAAILDHADALRAKRSQVRALLDTLTQSVFEEMFRHEPIAATVADVADDVRTGPFGSQLLHGEFVSEGIAVLGLDNVVGNDFRWREKRFITPAKYQRLRRYTVHPGDVLISIMGTTGRCVVVPEGIPTAINTKHICAITANHTRIDPTFLRAAFLWHRKSRAHLRQQTKGSIMDGLNMGIIKAMPIPVPALQLQRAFAERTQEIERVRSISEHARIVEDELFSSLQYRASLGEL